MYYLNEGRWQALLDYGEGGKLTEGNFLHFPDIVYEGYHNCQRAAVEKAKAYAKEKGIDPLNVISTYVQGYIMAYYAKALLAHIPMAVERFYHYPSDLPDILRSSAHNDADSTAMGSGADLEEREYIHEMLMGGTQEGRVSHYLTGMPGAAYLTDNPDWYREVYREQFLLSLPPLKEAADKERAHILAEKRAHEAHLSQEQRNALVQEWARREGYSFVLNKAEHSWTLKSHKGYGEFDYEEETLDDVLSFLNIQEDY